ncbi:class C sortase [Trueperella pecoris]|uniref:Class C sortase n=1 Tax=Trueperella pecoris TaxID=2733571 RepID=A0A7M1QWL6_9ACTO|nr:class C sortase [Trueperella pecoris]QOQ39475.1 class C sortase [Trueperella pecoris]QOR45904.1 class C sortase [Trueperella pecoris]QTG75731.1 class C sortase [Trueperella pecoris]
MPRHRTNHSIAAPRRWIFPKLVAFGSSIMLLGVMLAVYPLAASWFSQYHQSALIARVVDEQKGLPSKQIDARIAEAREYNRLLVGGVIVEANQNKASANVESEGRFDYYSLLNGASSVMGRLRIDAIDVDLPIYHGTSDATLAKGVGHLRGTALPVGGRSQRPVLTAHRGLPESTLFNDLDRVALGDTFIIETFGEVLTYRVVDTQVIDPADTESISVVDGKDLVSLITCTPLGINTHRILVTGERITPTPIADVERAGNTPDLPGFPWWAVFIGLAVVACMVGVWHAGYAQARKARDRDAEA